MKKIICLMLAAALLLTACGGSGAAAATMRLKRCEGTVGVSDDAGKDVEPMDNLDLYSGYGVDTRSESYAWIDLDSVKLTKLDQNSEIAITKQGKKLEIEVISGSLFFNVTKPLDDDETMNIRTSTMLVGIRGTCGWAALSEDGSALTVGLLEGKVECSNGESSAAVSAGEKGAIPAGGEITVSPLSAASVPAFVKAELEDDDTLAEGVKAASGIDVLAAVDPMRPRDMYTYSRALGYSADGELSTVSEYFPDEQGRIGRAIHRMLSNGYESAVECIYDAEGTLSKTVDSDGTVTGSITEDAADHRKWVSSDGRGVNIDYYDEQGRITKQESFYNGELNSYDIFTYDAAGKLIRGDRYGADDTPTGVYFLYEYD